VSLLLLLFAFLFFLFFFHFVFDLLLLLLLVLLYFFSSFQLSASVDANPKRVRPPGGELERISRVCVRVCVCMATCSKAILMTVLAGALRLSLPSAVAFVRVHQSRSLMPRGAVRSIERKIGVVTRLFSCRLCSCCLSCFFLVLVFFLFVVLSVVFFPWCCPCFNGVVVGLVFTYIHLYSP